jgi:hypothetical protein
MYIYLKKQPRIHSPSRYVHSAVCNARNRLSESGVPDFPEEMYKHSTDRLGKYKEDLAMNRMEVDTAIALWRRSRSDRGKGK